MKRQGATERDRLRRDLAVIGEDFDARIEGHVKRRGVGRIDVFCERDNLSVGALHQIKHQGAVARFCHFNKLVQVFGASRGNAVGELGDACFAR